MYTIRVSNVNEALCKLVRLLGFPDHWNERTTRGSRTLEWKQPVTTIYEFPAERVLLLAERDANPYFHLFEALWMLSGRNDVDTLARFVGRIREYSDDGDTLNGMAYGDRWRRRFGEDQLTTIIDMLKRDQHTRRAVLAMWDPMSDLAVDSKDLPCNTHVYFKIREQRLDMTVCCRSNDMVWGGYGANAVHFSMLQEYVAGALGILTGPMYQVSDSYHVYPDNAPVPALMGIKRWDDSYQEELVTTTPLWQSGETLNQWEDAFNQIFHYGLERILDIEAPWFLAKVAAPALRSWGAWEEFRQTKSHEDFEKAADWANKIEGADWSVACLSWIARRIEGKEKQ